MSNARKIIYLIEDPLLAQLMSAYLLTVFRGNIQVEKFSTFETAIARFDNKEGLPSVVYGAMMQAQGTALCSKVKTIDPSIRFILASGSPPENINDTLLQTDFLPDAVLHKPFSLEQVQGIVRILMADPPLVPLGMSKSGVWPFFPLQGAWGARAVLPQPVPPTPRNSLPHQPK